jgi:D-Tyr-tRNAtyr deacylase
MCSHRSWHRFSAPLDAADEEDDTSKDAESLAKKILTLRVFNDESNQQMWKRSVKDIEGEILCSMFSRQFGSQQFRNSLFTP